MRPTRLEVQGFSAFRQHTVVDLAGVDLFALTGATGAGKSSLIDAMVFALFGCIPRLDKKAIEPLVTLGMTEARVRLDFSVDGTGYSAVRVVRRKPNGPGAATKEARLERADGEVLAGNEKDLSSAVGRLLGLGVDEFTTCVVLPQGAFARFLHEPGKDRQDLLVKLLDLGLYDRMASAARQRQTAAATRAEVAETLLAKLASATPQAWQEAQARVVALEDLRAVVDDAEPAIEQLRSDEAEARGEAQLAAERASQLESVHMPAALATLDQALAEATEAAVRADALEEAACGVLDAAEAHVAAQPPLVDLQAVAEAHHAAAAWREQQAKALTLQAERRATEAVAQHDLAAADAAVVEADARLEAARWEHRVHDLAATLVAGEACPVCRQPVVDLPPMPEPAGSASLDPRARAEAAKGLAEERRLQAAGVLRSAERERMDIEAKLAGFVSQLAAAAPRVARHPDLAAVEDRMAEVKGAAETERQARTDAASARKLARSAHKNLADVQAREAHARRQFEQTRGDLVPFGPLPSGDVLVEDWKALVRWAAQKGDELRGVANRARAVVSAKARDRESAEQMLISRCQQAGMAVAAGSGRGPRQAVADALGQAAAKVTEIERDMADAVRHRQEAAEQRVTAQVAHQLAVHLSANHFEKWVLDEVLSSLVARATDLLVDLSAGAYSLALDDRSNFAVIDHRNADQVRSARTLSGGETFLASLALALALADQVGELASQGSARLESIFLDEGFGTLDPDTLDTVATAIEELGSRGRMVGLVSHVPELAERVPVRFQVQWQPGGSTVERLDR